MRSYALHYFWSFWKLYRFYRNIFIHSFICFDSSFILKVKEIVI
jgi:hypothetical protein